MTRQRGILLVVILCIFFALSAWIVYNAILAQRDTFMTGAPPQEIQDVIVPKELDASQLHPPALLTTDPIRYGGVSSSASVIEYGDYQCPACKDMSPILNSVVASYKGTVRLVWHDFPIPEEHPQALTAAIFARCAGDQGKYWEAHDALMQAPNLDEVTLISIMQQLSLDSSRMAACRADTSLRDAIMHEVDVARGDGLAHAPTIFVGATAYIGSMTEQELRTAIDSFLKE